MGRPVALLEHRVRLHPAARLDATEDVLWVRRRSVVERLFARIVHRGDAGVRLTLDARSGEVVRALARLGAPTVPELASALGVAHDADAVARKDPDLAALLVFLSALRRAGGLVTEPI